jgi:hypothetical protein
MRRAEKDTRLRVLGRCSSCSSCCRERERLGQTEVDDLHEIGGHRDEEIVRLDVSMDDSKRVPCTCRRRCLRDVTKRAIDGERTVLLERINVENSNGVWMIDRRRRTRLVGEASHRVRVAKKLAMHHFDRDRPTKPEMMRTKDGRHSSSAEHAINAVLSANDLADSDGKAFVRAGLRDLARRDEVGEDLSTALTLVDVQANRSFGLGRESPIDKESDGLVIGTHRHRAYLET